MQWMVGRTAVASVAGALFLALAGGAALAQASQDPEANEGGGSGDVTLRIAGGEGTRFSGTCSVGEEEHDVGGRVPQSFEYDLNGRKLVCEMRKEDAQEGAELEVVLEDENTRSVQRSEGGEDAVMRLVYEDGNVSSSTSSTSLQKSTSDTSKPSSAAANGATPGDDDLESLADQIQKKVDGIIERAMR